MNNYLEKCYFNFLFNYSKFNKLYFSYIIITIKSTLLPIIILKCCRNPTAIPLYIINNLIFFTSKYWYLYVLCIYSLLLFFDTGNIGGILLSTLLNLFFDYFVLSSAISNYCTLFLNSSINLCKLQLLSLCIIIGLSYIQSKNIVNKILTTSMTYIL